MTPSNSTRPTASGFGAALRMAHRLYNRRLQDHLSCRGMTAAQYLHLRTLWESGPLTQTEIAARLGIEKASSTGVLEALTRDGLVERSRDGLDRRRVILQLSPAGRRTTEAILPFARQIAERALDGVAAGDLARFLDVFDQVIRNLSRNETEPSPGLAPEGTAAGSSTLLKKPPLDTGTGT